VPRLAAFPKAFMQALCKDGTMKISEWIELASKLDIDGLEWYAGFLEMADEKNWPVFQRMVEDRGLKIPMLCCSPDFTHPDKSIRKKEIEKEKRWIDMTCVLGGSFCRILSGQRRPGLTNEEGLRITMESIQDCLIYAKERSITLILENHYKDDFWEYPEFAQKADIFCQLVNAIDHPNFGVNYDPSNAYLAGDDPIILLKRISNRVVTMHASDRFLSEGTIEDLQQEERGATGYAKRLKHGEIGKGLNDYDAIFTELTKVHFDGWISIEDGIEGMEQLECSVSFLRNKIQQYWTDHPSFTNQ
jgi:sugar phosphate isomerase/epimerase